MAEEEGKKMKKYFYYCFYFCFLLWAAFPFAVFAIWAADCELLIGTRGTGFFIQRILNWAAACSGTALALLHYRKTPKAFQNKAALFLTASGMAALLLCGNFLCILLDGTEDFHSFSSPDGAHRIVVMERVSLISGRVTLYERTGPFLISKRDSVPTDDGYRPVCGGKYALDWQGDTVTLTVADGMGGEEKITAVLKEG